MKYIHVPALARTDVVQQRRRAAISIFSRTLRTVDPLIPNTINLKHFYPHPQMPNLGAQALNSHHMQIDGQMHVAARLSARFALVPSYRDSGAEQEGVGESLFSLLSPGFFIGQVAQGDEVGGAVGVRIDYWV